MRDHQIGRPLQAALLAAALAAPAAGQESAAFLRLGGGARPLALGGQGTTLAPASDSLFYNPAGLARLGRPELGATHALFLGDSYDALSLAAPLGPASSGRGVLGLGVSRMGYRAMEARDESRRAGGEFSASDAMVSLGYAYPLPGGLSAGLAVKRVESRIAEASAGATAFDAGLGWDVGGPWAVRLGGAARNMGEDLRYSRQAYPLPLAFAAGLSMEPVPGLLVAGEASRRPRGNQTGFALGTEYRLHPLFAVRAGYLLDRGPGSAAWPRGGSAGFGLRWTRLSLDYALAPFGGLGSVQVFSLSARY